MIRDKKNKSFLILKIILLMIIIATAVFIFRHFKINEVLLKTLNWIKGIGYTGYAVFIVLYVLATVFFLPGSILTLGAGFLYGVLWGSILVSISSTLGAAASFLTGRYFARDWVIKKMENNYKFKAIDEAVAEKGWKIVLLCRLSPVFPFNLLNYAFGLTKVLFKHYFFASWIGMAPATVMYVYFGSLAFSLATLGAGGSQKTAAEWGLYIFGLLATLAAAFYITQIARKSLKRAIKQRNQFSAGPGK